MKLKTFALATAIALTPTLAISGGRPAIPMAEFPMSFDTKSDANAFANDFRKNELNGWFAGIRDWTAGKRKANTELKRAGEITKAERKERNKALKAKKSAAKQDKKQANKDTKAEARSRVSGGGLSL